MSDIIMIQLPTKAFDYLLRDAISILCASLRGCIAPGSGNKKEQHDVKSVSTETLCSANRYILQGTDDQIHVKKFAMKTLCFMSIIRFRVDVFAGGENKLYEEYGYGSCGDG